MKYLRKRELIKLPDHRLLALYRRTRKRMHTAYAYITDYGNNPEILSVPNNSEVEDCVRLDEYCDKIKYVLNTREHIEKRKK